MIGNFNNITHFIHLLISISEQCERKLTCEVKVNDLDAFVSLLEHIISCKELTHIQLAIAGTKLSIDNTRKTYKNVDFSRKGIHHNSIVLYLLTDSTRIPTTKSKLSSNTVFSIMNRCTIDWSRLPIGYWIYFNTHITDCI